MRDHASFDPIYSSSTKNSNRSTVWIPHIQIHILLTLSKEKKRKKSIVPKKKKKIDSIFNAQIEANTLVEEQYAQ